MNRKFVSYGMFLYFTLLFGSILGIVVNSLIAKTLGKSALGTYSYFTSALSIATVVLSFGTPELITKSIAEDDPNAKDFARFMLGLVIGAMVISVVAALLLFPFIGELYALLLVTVPHATLMPIASGIFRGYVTMRPELVYRLMRRILNIVILAALIAVVSSPGDNIVIYGIVLSWVIGSLFLITFTVKNELLIGFRGFLDSARQGWLRAKVGLATNIWISDIIIISGAHVDGIVIGQSLGFTELGEYAGAVVFFTFVGQFLTVWGRLFTTIIPRGKNREIKNYNKLLSIISITHPAFALATLAIIPITTELVLDSSYTLTEPIFAIIGISFIFRPTEQLGSTLALTLDVPKYIRRATSVSMAIYIPTLFILLSQLGLYGAAISRVVFTALYSTLLTYYLRKVAPEHASLNAKRMLQTALGYSIAMLVYLVVKHPVARFIFPISTFVLLSQIIGYGDVGYLLKLLIRMIVQQTDFVRRKSEEQV